MPGSFRGGTSVTDYFLMSPVGSPSPFSSETSAIQWATFDKAAKLIGMTTHKIGRARDLSVLGAARLALKVTRSISGRALSRHRSDRHGAHFGFRNTFMASPAVTKWQTFALWVRRMRIELNYHAETVEEAICQAIVAYLGYGMPPREILDQLIARGFVRDPGNNALEDVVQGLANIAEQMRRDRATG